jgi:hypothetical protein
MVDAQMWIVSTFARWTMVREFMHTQWAWPLAESIHFIGLSLLVGTIFLFDLRLLGVANRIPLLALHKLVPWGLAGFASTLVTGMLFLIAEPDQYVYNPSFHWKVAFMLAAGANASLFYVIAYRDLAAASATAAVPPRARAIAVASLTLWVLVIIAGRLLTFYRPAPCEPGEAGVLARCIPEYYR